MIIDFTDGQTSDVQKNQNLNKLFIKDEDVEMEDHHQVKQSTG